MKNYCCDMKLLESYKKIILDRLVWERNLLGRVCPINFTSTLS